MRVCVCVVHGRYLAALGQAKTAEVQRDARIGEAEAKRDAGVLSQSIYTHTRTHT